MKDEKVCVVLLCNAAFFGKMLYTLNGIRASGYTQDVCVVIGDDLKDHSALNHPLLANPRTCVKHFSDISFDEKFLNSFQSIDRPAHWKEKIFQYHKLHLFDTCFKQWDFIFYIDAGAHILGSIQPIIDVRKKGKILAHSDAYHTYTWRLRDQFDSKNSKFFDLSNNFNLEVDYPQTTIMLYDTSIINNDTSSELINLARKWDFSITNDQGIIALYFTNINPVWEQITLGDDNQWYYDFMIRDHKKDKKHLILKRV